MSLSLAELKRLQAYDDWANGRLFDSLAALSEEQSARKQTSSFPSLRETVAHILGAQATYHRGQATTLLRQLGATPLGTDFVLFVRENP
jgi:uncharacterized damage-inducible protein DinB